MRKQKRVLRFRYKLLIGLNLGFLITAICCFIVSMICSIIDMPNDYSNLLGLVLSVVFAYSSAYITAKLNQREGILCGVIVFIAGTAVFLICSLLSMYFSNAIIKLILMLIFTIIGGIIGVNSRIKKY